MSRGKILLVDDDTRNIFALAAVLKSRHYTCVSETDAMAAIQKIRDEGPFLAVLLDMMMPDVDGYEATRIIRETPELADTLIIAVTAQAMAGDRDKCLEAGADFYLSKPVDVDKLMSILESIE